MELKSICMVLLMAILIVYIVINKSLREKLKVAFNSPIFKSKFLLKDWCAGLIIVIVILAFAKNIVGIVEDLKYKNTSISEQEKILEESNKKAESTLLVYKDIISNIQTDLEKCKNPYIPENFKYVEGEWNTGFVIEDENKNQFVWVPCTNQKNNEQIPVLKKSNFVANPFTSYFYCYEEDESFIEFLKSSLENGGFYIARFEIGKDDTGNPVSKENVDIWNNVSWEEAKSIAENMYDKNIINSKLINGFAYDTAFSFIYSEVEGNNSDEKNTGITGTKSYKNIYDIVDSMYEYTTEMQYDNCVYRGVMEENEYISSSSTLDCSRLVGEIDYKSSNIGFRTILYK